MCSNIPPVPHGDPQSILTCHFQGSPVVSLMCVLTSLGAVSPQPVNDASRLRLRYLPAGALALGQELWRTFRDMSNTPTGRVI